jgi:hypothetical protein
MLSSVVKVVIICVVFPVQVNMFELGDYCDAWDRLDQVVGVVVRQVGEEKQKDVEDQGG